MPHCRIRDRLLNAILDFLPAHDLLPVSDVRAALEREIDHAGPDAVSALRQQLTRQGGWEYYPPDPLARAIHHLLADRFLAAGSEVAGLDALAQIDAAPVAIVSNHLSYADANVIEVLLHRAGGDGIADRLTAIAGPKVFSNRARRFSSLCFGVVKVPQSAGVASDEAVRGARDVARAARQAIDVATTRLAAGDALLLFGEGTRSRTGKMQPMLPGVARYLTGSETWILPAALTGPERLYPIDDVTIHPARVRLRIGVPFRAGALAAAAAMDRRVMIDAVALAVADLLPPEYRGAYADGHDFAAARRALADVRP